MSQSPRPTPHTDDEWIVHSINIHGVFFERWCRHIIEQAHGWKVKLQNFPVEFPVGNSATRGEESAVDLTAQRSFLGIGLFTLVIECKKNNPDLVNWVFFKKTNSSGGRVQVVNPASPPGASAPKRVFNQFRSSVDIVDEARETKGNYEELSSNDKAKTKTSNKAISDAAYQVALATQFLIDVEVHRPVPEDAKDVLRWKQVFLPLIVTTARLMVCRFEASDVDPATGEIPLRSPKLEEKPYVYFEFPLPPHLQVLRGEPPVALSSPWEFSREVERRARMHILVANARSLSTVLDKLAEDPPAGLLDSAAFD